jgi:hypothetical protein
MSAAFTAVLKIGSPALPALVKNLESSDDADMRRSSLEAICEIDGKDKDLSQFRLREAIQRQTDSKKKERLQSALQILLNDSKFQK